MLYVASVNMFSDTSNVRQVSVLPVHEVPRDGDEARGCSGGAEPRQLGRRRVLGVDPGRRGDAERHPRRVGVKQVRETAFLSWQS